MDLDQLLQLAQARASALSAPPVEDRAYLRHKGRLSQPELAAVIESMTGKRVSCATISRWESGQRNPSGDRGAAYCTILRRLAELREVAA